MITCLSASSRCSLLEVELLSSSSELWPSSSSPSEWMSLLSQPLPTTHKDNQTLQDDCGNEIDQIQSEIQRHPANISRGGWRRGKYQTNWIAGKWVSYNWTKQKLESREWKWEGLETNIFQTFSRLNYDSCMLYSSSRFLENSDFLLDRWSWNSLSGNKSITVAIVSVIKH